MHSIISQVCKEQSRHINKEFVEKVNFKWLDKEFKVNEWSDENKRKYRIPFSIVRFVADGIRQKKATVGALAEPWECTWT